MPLQTLVIDPPLKKVKKLTEGGYEGAKELDAYYVRQGVGLKYISANPPERWFMILKKIF